MHIEFSFFSSFLVGCLFCGNASPKRVIKATQALWEWPIKQRLCFHYDWCLNTAWTILMGAQFLPAKMLPFSKDACLTSRSEMHNPPSYKVFHFLSSCMCNDGFLLHRFISIFHILLLSFSSSLSVFVDETQVLAEDSFMRNENKTRSEVNRPAAPDNQSPGSMCLRELLPLDGPGKEHWRRILAAFPLMKVRKFLSVFRQCWKKRENFWAMDSSSWLLTMWLVWRKKICVNKFKTFQYRQWYG